MIGVRKDPCNLCPRMCGAHRLEGETGYCGADGRLLVARSALHFWEEPPISGEAGSGTVFFSGCPLHCVYCQNASLASCSVGWPVDEGRLADMCLDLQAQGALNVNFVTPTHYALDILGALQIARDKGLHLPVVWNTSGYERVETIEHLAGHVDVYLADFKYANDELAQRYSHAPDYKEVARDAIRAMVESTGEARYDEYGGQRRMVGGVIVRHLVLPGSLENSRDALSFLWNEFGDQVTYSIMNQYTPVLSENARLRYPELANSVSSEDYESVLDFADSLGMEDYFWQDAPADLESFIPTWNGEGVI